MNWTRSGLIQQVSLAKKLTIAQKIIIISVPWLLCQATSEQGKADQQELPSEVQIAACCPKRSAYRKATWGNDVCFFLFFLVRMEEYLIMAATTASVLSVTAQWRGCRPS